MARLPGEGKLEGEDLPKPPAEPLQSGGQGGELLLHPGPLHGYRRPAHLEEGQKELGEDAERGHGPGHRPGVGLPVARLPGEDLRPAPEGPGPLEPKDLYGPLHEGHLLPGGVHEDELQLGADDLQGKAGKPRPRPQVQDP